VAFRTLALRINYSIVGAAGNKTASFQVPLLNEVPMIIGVSKWRLFLEHMMFGRFVKKVIRNHKMRIP
jgi:hypothetical protein